MKTNKIPKHIYDIYKTALKDNIYLKKMIFTGIRNKYNVGKMRAAYFVQYYMMEKRI